MEKHSVRVHPPVVVFRDVRVGQRYDIKVTAANVGKTMKKIFMEKPLSKVFELTTSGRAEMVAPGLSVSGKLGFIPEKNKEVQDCLKVHVDDAETIDIPLHGFPRSCNLLMDAVVNFGCTAASSQVITRHHSVTNQGSLPGYFHVQYAGDPSFTISPSSGVICPGDTVWLKVELRTDKPRLLVEKAVVKLQNYPALLTIRAEVVDQCLELFDLKGAPLSCLSFGPVRFGTSSTKTVVLSNSGPLACDWVCVLQLSPAGTEVGTDLQKSAEAALLERLERSSSLRQGSFPGLCVPDQGRLAPYERTKVAVRFSPLSNSSPDVSGFRQDYCLFLLFESVGSKHGFTNHSGKSSVELAVTGTGLPVVLVPYPSHDFDFGTCKDGQQVDLLCVLQNVCPLLPIIFRFQKLAHFTSEPASGKIPPGQSQDVVLSFKARQNGKFKVCQRLDVLGLVHEDGDQQTEEITPLKLDCIHSITLNLTAVCCSRTAQLPPKLNPGLIPPISNPAGQRPDIRYSELSRCYAMVRAAVLCSHKTRLHEHQRKSQNTNEKLFLAFPNDRAASVRPADADTEYRTIFTGMTRYHYIDATYAFTVEEEKQRKQHEQIYTNFLIRRRQARLQKIKESKKEKIADVDLGMIPAHGLVPPTLGIKDLKQEEFSEPRTQRNIQDVPSLAPKLLGGSEENNAVPSSFQEAAACSRTLTPQELYRVELGPLFVHFGQVCLESVCLQLLEMTNNLSACVWVQLQVDCPELQGSSPLSHILPPHSQSKLLLMFQSSRLGHFYRTIGYSVNQKHFGQIVVQADVVSLALELSTSLLVLSPSPMALATSEYRSCVTVRNRRNHAAEFSWRTVVTEKGNPFTVQPTTGTVEPHSEVDCEVVWHPSFSSPLEGDFDLWVHGGTTQHLHCVAKIGSTSVQVAETQLTLKSVPLNMDSTRTAVIYNTGPNHTYFKVLDVCPLPGMVVSPPEGVVPCGGNAALTIHFNPDSVVKFDTRIKIALRNMKSVEFRVVGSVEPPDIDISVSHFQFNRVHAGSRKAAPFTLTNGSSAPTRVTFDFSENAEFSLQMPQPPAAVQQPGSSVVEIQAKQKVDCWLVFSPTQAATYDFQMPMKVSGVRWSAAALPPTPSTSATLSARGNKHLIKYMPVTMATPQTPLIQATALCAPLEMSPSALQCHVEYLKLDSDGYIIKKTVMLQAVGEESLYWQSSLEEEVHWWFDCSEQRRGDLWTVSPSSGSLRSGQSICLDVSVKPNAFRKGTERETKLSVPLYLGGESPSERGNEPYRELVITVTFQRPCITFHPPQILLSPVPLETKASATLTLHALGYPRGTTLSAEVDEVELEDGTKIRPVSVCFPGGSISHPPLDELAGVWMERPREASLTCTVTFCSSRPLSLSTHLTFVDHLHNRFRVGLCANADSCLLTVWPFMALSRSEQKIVLQPGLRAVEVVRQGRHHPTPPSGPSPSSLFYPNSSAGSASLSGSSDSDGSSRNTDLNRIFNTPTDLGFPTFPAANSEEGMFYEKVLLALKKWFSFFGWPWGPHPISVPQTLRRVVSKTLVHVAIGQSQRVTVNRDIRSVLNMLQHLTGQVVPGIACCRTFSGDLTQRTQELLNQHQAVLTFLRIQGALVSHIRPAFLLDIQEFKHWCSMQANEENAVDYSCVDYESLSKRCWTDVLLQIYKVLVLPRVSNSNNGSSSLDSDGILPFSPQSLSSNVYSRTELQLLSWINLHYQSSRETLQTRGGGGPLARWIVNFDLDFKDGLVLAALLSAYCPYLIHSHFQRMYMRPGTSEQTTHNNIIVCQALTTLNLNFDIQLADLCSPNPVQMLMLCVHLHERLPQYFPQQTIELSGGLHTVFSRQVRLKNPSSKPVRYQACLLGATAHLFSLPSGSSVTIPAMSSTELSVVYHCCFLQPMEAYLLLISSSRFGLQGSTLAFRVTTHISHITPTNSVRCKSPCYQLKVIQVPITNTFTREATFRVVLVESEFDPLESIKKKEPELQDTTFKASVGMTTSEKSCGEEMEEKSSAVDTEASDFHSALRSIFLTPEQEETLNIHYLPFFPVTKYCSVLLACPEVGDMVYIIKATGELPLPSSPLTARASENIVAVGNNTVLRLQCEIGQVCEEVVRVPRLNWAWGDALAAWGQFGMSEDEHRRRRLTQTLDSSSVRANAAARKFPSQMASVSREQLTEGLDYNVQVSFPQYFFLPSVVQIPLKEDARAPWQDLADCCWVDIPLRFQADCVGHFTCQVVLSSCFDIRVYEIEAVVTSQRECVHLDFNSPVHHSVTQDIPLSNETQRDWKIHAELCGEGFSGPKVVDVPAGTKSCYSLTFHPPAQCVVMGKLSLHNECSGNVSVFILRGVGQRPPPVDRVVLRCPVGQSTHAQLNVPNYSQKTITVKVETDLPVVSGNPSLELEPAQNTPYNLSVTPWEQGKQTGFVSFQQSDDMQEIDKDSGDILGHYMVYFSVEIICKPAAPVRVIDVQCASGSSVEVEIPVSNPGNEDLDLSVCLEGDDLSGVGRVLISPQDTFIYRATYSPVVIGKGTGSVWFRSKLVGEFWYQLHLYALPPAVLVLPQIYCPLGKWTRQSLPLVNPTAERLQLLVSNTNPRNYTVATDCGNTLTLERHSFTQVAVHFRPSFIGEGKHTSKITFSCPQLQEWCVRLSGCGLNPERMEAVSISSPIGSSASTAIPFTNPTELPVMVDVTLTDKDPTGVDSQVITGIKVFSIPLNHTEGIQVSEGGTFDVPVVFRPKSALRKQAWLSVTMKPVGSSGVAGAESERPEVDLATACWNYHLFGIPVDESAGLVSVHCEAGQRVTRTVDVQLAGYVSWTCTQMGQEAFQVSAEDFVCSVHSDGKAELDDCLSALVEAGRRDPQTSLITLTLRILYAPLKTCRSSVVLVVNCVSGTIWKIPIDLIATEPLVDNVLVIESAEVGKTSAVGFRLTSATRRSVQFTAALLPGSSRDFTVAPSSGFLPPVGSAGKLISVSFTPTSALSEHRARLTIQAVMMQRTYKVKGTILKAPPIYITSANGSSYAPPPAKQKKNFVVENLQIPNLANSSPLKQPR